MKIKDQSQKKRVGDRLRRIEGQIRGVIQMIEDEVSVKDVVQQLSAVRSAMGQAMNEELLCVIEKITERRGEIDEKELDEIRTLLRFIR